LLDEPRLSARSGSFEPCRREGLGQLPPGFFECPASWSQPTAYAVARGATGLTSPELEADAFDGLIAAIDELAPHCSAIVTDCGLFYRARDTVARPSDTMLVLSGLELIEIAADRTRGPIGLLTHMPGDLDCVLEELRARERLALLTVAGQPAWEALAEPDYATAPKWTTAALREQLAATVQLAVSPGGAWEHVAAIVIECTFMPQFADDIRLIAGRPVYDASTLVMTSPSSASPRTVL
jgi:hypothetical protein